MEDIKAKFLTELEDQINSIPDEEIANAFRPEDGLPEEIVKAMLDKIGALLDDLGIPHLFIAGFNGGNNTEFSTFTHTVGATSTLSVLINAVAVSNPDYESFFIEIGHSLKTLAEAGILNEKRLFHKGRYLHKKAGIDPDDIFGKSVPPGNIPG